MGRGTGVPHPRGAGHGTRLSRWHSYPAMVPDDLALTLAEETVKPGDRVLDPFCGSGRLLLAASDLGADCVGFDTNPLACLITEAKAASASISTISAIAAECADAARLAPRIPGVALRNTTVEWFSDSVSEELAQIVRWVNTLDLPRPDLLVAATALSAATRDASWIRKSGWKLHRLAEGDRRARTKSAWTSFSTRLRQYVDEGERRIHAGGVVVHQLRADEGANTIGGRFDVILTSPPYGDSKTTVQYGAASAIFLDVASRLRGLEDYYAPGRDIDRSCLGGRGHACPSIELKRFWAGAPDSEGGRRVTTFLADFAFTCRRLADLVEPSGIFAIVVGRRSVGGYRVKLDEFAVLEMEALGFKARSVKHRRLQQKRLPRAVNRFARAASLEHRCSGRTKTIDEEIIVTFDGPQQRSALA